MTIDELMQLITAHNDWEEAIKQRNLNCRTWSYGDPNSCKAVILDEIKQLRKTLMQVAKEIESE